MHSIENSSACLQILGSKSQVMLKFSAEWCGPCKVVSPIIEKLAPQFPDVFMAEIDIDKSQDVAAQYGITAVPSFVFFHNGTEIDRVKGANISAVTEALRALAARTPSYGKGYLVGSGLGDSASTTGSKSRPSPEELRAMRARAFGNSSRTELPEKSHAKTIPTLSETVQTSKESDSDSPGLLSNLIYYFLLYVYTLFSFDARAKAATLKRKT